MAIGCVRFARYCGKMYSRCLFFCTVDWDWEPLYVPLPLVTACIPGCCHQGYYLMRHQHCTQLCRYSRKTKQKTIKKEWNGGFTVKQNQRFPSVFTQYIIKLDVPPRESKISSVYMYGQYPFHQEIIKARKYIDSLQVVSSSYAPKERPTAGLPRKWRTLRKSRGYIFHSCC